jgi:hypothetical protein
VAGKAANKGIAAISTGPWPLPRPAATANTLPLEVVVTAQERGQARDLDATGMELLAKLGEGNTTSDGRNTRW